MNPHQFFSHIQEEVDSLTRVEMAHVALHLYFDKNKFPYDLSRLQGLNVAGRLKCFSAMN